MFLKKKTPYKIVFPIVQNYTRIWSRKTQLGNVSFNLVSIYKKFDLEMSRTILIAEICDYFTYVF